mgnify:CR=1 FL=1
MKVVLFCGGMGMRMRPLDGGGGAGEDLPKPMVHVGGQRPLIWHVMKYYAHYGHKDFILCLGYKGEIIKDYFRNYLWHTSDVTLRLGKNPAIERLARATFDISEYVVDIAKKEGLAPGLETIEGGVSLHLACHARAQNMGPKAAEMLRLAPKTRVAVIERCSGHGGIWGARTENFDIAVKVGKPAAQAALKNDTSYVASECPLAAEHLLQVMEMTAGDAPPKPKRADHPIEILARAYGLVSGE